MFDAAAAVQCDVYIEFLKFGKICLGNLQPQQTLVSPLGLRCPFRVPATRPNAQCDRAAQILTIGITVRRHGELLGLKSLRVFAAEDGHVAAHAVNLSGLVQATGLSARGYVYTDRPAYQPGQTVGIRGIIRDVTDGSYVAPAEPGATRSRSS